MCKLIAFSGASNSGKTTTINKIISLNSDILHIDEIVRRREKINIDEIRSNPSEYLNFVCDITLKKIEEQSNIYQTYAGETSKIVLLDRSIIDDLFYGAFYLEKSKLGDADLQRYADVFKKVQEYIKANIYHKILIFQPIQFIDYDEGWRTEKLKHLQAFEYFFIRNMTYALYPPTKILDVETKDIPKLIDTIRDM